MSSADCHHYDHFCRLSEMLKIESSILMGHNLRTEQIWALVSVGISPKERTYSAIVRNSVVFDRSSAAVISLRLHPSDFGFSQSVCIQFCVGPTIPVDLSEPGPCLFPTKSELLLPSISFLRPLYWGAPFSGVCFVNSPHYLPLMTRNTRIRPYTTQSFSCSGLCARISPIRGYNQPPLSLITDTLQRSKAHKYSVLTKYSISRTQL